jgi:hypothetical protein
MVFVPHKKILLEKCAKFGSSWNTFSNQSFSTTQWSSHVPLCEKHPTPCPSSLSKTNKKPCHLPYIPCERHAPSSRYQSWKHVSQPTWEPSYTMEQPYVPCALGKSCISEESPMCWSLFGYALFGLSCWMTCDHPPFELWGLKIVRENKQIRDWGKKDGGGKIKKFPKKTQCTSFNIKRSSMTFFRIMKTTN